MKKLFFLLFILVLATCLGFFWFRWVSGPAGKETKFQDFLITKGSSASQIGGKLKKEGLIKNSLAFKFYVQMAGKAGKIQAGEYRLSSGYSLSKIVEELVRGPLGIWVTIPEGFRKEEIAGKFADLLEKEDKESFVKEFLQASIGQEGYLFPDTYIFLKNASASAISQKMQATFVKKVGTEAGKEQLIIASLVERETKAEAERPIVAGIIYKRIQSGWPLQIDAALQYAIATDSDWWPILTKEDIAIKSNYNTYQHSGLPPTPICNPGLSSIKAAISPEESVYWFYLHDTEGQIHYAQTLEEHNANIKRYLGK
jgi:UPF0755 protein